MSYGTIIQSGVFTSTGTARTIPLRSDVDVFQTYNYTTAAAGIAVNTALRYTWFRGMAAGDGFFEGYNAAGGGAFIIANSAGLNVPGFYLVDSNNISSASIAVTAGTNATQPVYNTANTGILANGGVVRVFGTGQANINGLDFSVDTVVGNVSFRLANALQQAPGVIAGAAGFWKYIAPDAATYAAMYPGKRVIANITAANPGVITTLVDHGYTNGQLVRLAIEPGTGMEGLNGQLVTVTVVNASSFSIGIDTTGYTPFVFPLAGVVFTPSQVVPVGQDTAFVNNLGDATENKHYLGIVLGAGAQSPAGVLNDVIHWIAYKSENL